MNLGNESETQVFKEGLGQLDRGLKSLIAMLNRHGYGTVSGNWEKRTRKKNGISDNESTKNIKFHQRKSQGNAE